MPAILATIGATLGKIGISLLMGLLTEDFCKKLIVHSLEKIASWTESDIDNKLLADVKEAWKID